MMAEAGDWKTLGLILGTYLAWAGVTVVGASLPVLAVVPAGLLIALHASLTHEAVHGHPFRRAGLNEALLFAPLSLAVPYRRFRDLHLAHHRDARLTDPYDDPESNYLDPQVWQRLPGGLRWVLRLNNTLAGRMLLGPLIGQIGFMCADWRRARAGDREVIAAWGLHLPGVALVLGWVWAVGMPVWAYGAAAYLGLAILRIRTFAEHRAHARSRARTVIIEDRGLLGFLFLNNNLHVVHHMHPRAPWYALPDLYRAGRARYQACNDGYVYRSYGALFRDHLWRAKDPVPHPLWSSGQGSSTKGE
ncbi:MAG: fatty acid desaturase [Marinibacterium sp.]|nr:fatty acid desaturase [Marinibacterium sp.]